MSSLHSAIASLSDADLVSRVGELVKDERRATARLVAALAEFDRRQLYLPQGCSSLFTYCTHVLHLSEHAAYNRIEVARASLAFPPILERLADGSVTLTAIRLLAPVLTPENRDQLLASAQYKTRREIELLVAKVRGDPCAPPGTDRPIEGSGMTGSERTCPLQFDPRERFGFGPQHAAIWPVASDRYRIQFTVSSALHDKLRRAQDLLRHVIPNGNPAEIFSRALDVLLAKIERQRLALVDRPRAQRPATPGSRHIPAAVRREVWQRDGSQCAFVGAAGRCPERSFLQFHHVLPFADGGLATAANIELRCHAHNAYEAREAFGPRANEVEEGRNSFQNE